MPLDVVLPVPFALVDLPECDKQGSQGNGSDECLDNQIGGVYIDAKNHWMVTVTFLKRLFEARELLCARHFIPSFYFRYSYRLMNRSVSSCER